MFAFKDYRIKNFNFALVLLTVALCILGYMVLESAVVHDLDGAETLEKQLYGFLAGGLIMLFLTFADYHFWLKLHWLVYAGMIGILGLCFTPLRVVHTGAARWIRIPGLGQLQPSEFAKAMMILFFAWYFSNFRQTINNFRILMIAVALFIVPAVMIFGEPDLSTTLTFGMIFLIMFYVVGLSYKWIGLGVATVVPLATGLLVWDSMQEQPKIMKEYMLNRIYSWLDPTTYSATGLVDQQSRAVLAISSGQLHGKGLFNSSFESVKNGNFLSEENCDFIFAVVGEELGFVGSVAVILLFFLLVIVCFRAAGKAPDMEGRLICIGVGAWLGLQVFINIGVTSAVLPNTGVVLPFFSAGLSSLVSMFAGLGLVMNVCLQKPEREPDLW